MAGAEELLKEKRIRAIYAQLTGENGQRIREYLTTFGYCCHLFDRNGKLYTPSELPAHTNRLFLPG